MRTLFLLDRFPDLDPYKFQDPADVAAAVRGLLLLPLESVVAEVTVLPMKDDFMAKTAAGFARSGEHRQATSAVRRGRGWQYGSRP